jgi:predicted GTPase
MRSDQIATHHPGEAVAWMADVAVVNKVDAATAADVAAAVQQIRQVNSRAVIVHAASPVRLDDPSAVCARRVLIVEDGPTITHGGMAYGAGYVAALAAGAREIVDPRVAAAPLIRDVFRNYPHIGRVLPALRYSQVQLDALAKTINDADADVVVAATPINLGHLIQVNKPVVRARYAFAESGEPTLGSIIDSFLMRHWPTASGR